MIPPGESCTHVGIQLNIDSMPYVQLSLSVCSVWQHSAFAVPDTLSNGHFLQLTRCL